jgi:hypothetical protein
MHKILLVIDLEMTVLFAILEARQQAVHRIRDAHCFLLLLCVTMPSDRPCLCIVHWFSAEESVTALHSTYRPPRYFRIQQSGFLEAEG